MWKRMTPEQVALGHKLVRHPKWKGAEGVQILLHVYGGLAPARIFAGSAEWAYVRDSRYRWTDTDLDLLDWATGGALLGLLEEAHPAYAVKNESGWEIELWDGDAGELLTSSWGHTLAEACALALLTAWGDE